VAPPGRSPGSGHDGWLAVTGRQQASGRYSQALCRDTAGWLVRHRRKAGPADGKALPYCPSVSCARGATEVRSSRNIDLVYTWINERYFLCQATPDPPAKQGASGSDNRVMSGPRPEGTWAVGQTTTAAGQQIPGACGSAPRMPLAPGHSPALCDGWRFRMSRSPRARSRAIHSSTREYARRNGHVLISGRLLGLAFGHGRRGLCGDGCHVGDR
jgi:hypothetical protein